MYTDPIDGIEKWELGDMIPNLATKMNVHLDSVGGVTNAIKRRAIYKVDNVAERTALVTTLGASTITNLNPLYVDRADAPTGRKLEVSRNGTTWNYISSSDDITKTTVTITDTRFELYTAGYETVVAREGNWVNINGTYKPNVANIIQGINAVNFGTIPVGFRPTRDCIFVCQGSGSDQWSFSVHPAGNVRAARYSGTQNVGAWLPIDVTYRID